MVKNVRVVNLQRELCWCFYSSLCSQLSSRCLFLSLWGLFHSAGSVVDSHDSFDLLINTTGARAAARPPNRESGVCIHAPPLATQKAMWTNDKTFVCALRLHIFLIGLKHPTELVARLMAGKKFCVNFLFSRANLFWLLSESYIRSIRRFANLLLTWF